MKVIPQLSRVPQKICYLILIHTHIGHWVIGSLNRKAWFSCFFWYFFVGSCARSARSLGRFSQGQCWISRRQRVWFHYETGPEKLLTMAFLGPSSISWELGITHENPLRPMKTYENPWNIPWNKPLTSLHLQKKPPCSALMVRSSYSCWLSQQTYPQLCFLFTFKDDVSIKPQSLDDFPIQSSMFAWFYHQIPIKCPWNLHQIPHKST